jgi:hypothetical protein
MMFRVTCPQGWRPERCWISDVVLGEFLGLSFELGFDHASTTRISAAGKTLSLSDAFFAGAPAPAGKAQRWAVAHSGLAPRLCGPDVPVLFGAPGFGIDEKGDAALGLDVFGAAFFMLARYEETVNTERDAHDRFPAGASMAGRMDFLDRPIVDEYVDILWAAMQRLWPRLERKPPRARTFISCDVDSPFDPACASLARLGKRLLGRAWRDRSLGALRATVGNYCAVKRGIEARDPYWHAFSWMMDVNDKAGNQVTFNFIPEPTDRTMDAAPSLQDPRLRKLLRAIHARGHLIGFHPGYNTYRHPAAFAQSFATLRRVMDEEHICQDVLGGRQHYLRWDVRTTARLWAAHDLSYDSTLSYATVPGFRTGTCREYTMYDVCERRPLALKQRPLVLMESSVIDEGHMGLGHGAEALATMQHYKRICRTFDGDFTFLWHNSSFSVTSDLAMYSDLIN